MPQSCGFRGARGFQCQNEPLFSTALLQHCGDNAHFWSLLALQPLPRRPWEEKKNIPKLGGTPPLLDCNHPVDVSRLSHGNVPSVPRTFCPIYGELRINQVGTSRMSQGSPPNCPLDIPRQRTDHQTPLCFLSLSVFFSLALKTISTRIKEVKVFLLNL